METQTKLIDAVELADRLGLSAKWLRREASAGRIPHLRAGDRTLYNVDAVERELVRRASETVEVGYG